MCDHLLFSEPTLDIREPYITDLNVRPHQRTGEGSESGADTHLALARCQSHRNGIPGLKES